MFETKLKKHDTKFIKENKHGTKIKQRKLSTDLLPSKVNGKDMLAIQRIIFLF